MANENPVLDKVYYATNHDELMDAYKDWAGRYDDDVVGKFGYVAPVVSSELLIRYLDDKNARILDAGCGTGLVGEILKKAGYTNVDGLDYSQEMLDESEKKGVYKEYIQADMTKPLEIADNAYDAIICVGTFTLGHVGPSAFTELIRITKKGGPICLTIREGAFEQEDYRRAMLDLECKNQWELHEFVTTDYLKEEGVTCKLCLFSALV